MCELVLSPICVEVLHPVRFVATPAAAAHVGIVVDDVQEEVFSLELVVDVEADGAHVVAETEGFGRAGLFVERVDGLG